MASSRITARDIDLLVSPGQTAQEAAAFARLAFEEAQARNTAALGYPPDFEHFVDGRRGAPLESVKIPGTISFVFDLQFGVVEWIYQQLLVHAPRLSGRYAASIFVYADGARVAGVEMIHPGVREVVFLPTVAYARKIEKGRSSKAPQGVMEVVAQKARARFGNVAKVRFTYEAPTGGGTHIEQWAHSRTGRSKTQRGRDLRNPAIKVTF